MKIYEHLIYSYLKSQLTSKLKIYLILNSDFNLHQFINFIKNDLTPKFQIKILKLNRFSACAVTRVVGENNWCLILLKLKAIDLQ
jgi:hypothetical protein